MDMKSISQKLQDDIRAIMEAGLHPNQQRIDVHEPEKDKITADDFKKLRAMKKTKDGKVHNCATHVEHAVLGKGTTVSEQHAEPDENGDIAWYTVEFETGTQQIATKELTITMSEAHVHESAEEQVDEEEKKKIVSPFDYKNYKSQIPKKPGETAGFDSKKISTGTVYSRKPVKEESHQSKTTMKHIPNASPALKKAAKDIKPGIAGYRDRVAMLKAGGVKEDFEQIDEISTKLLAKAAHSASDPSKHYDDDEKFHDPQKFADHAKKTKDAKSASAVQGAANAKGHYPRPGHTTGAYDKLAYRKPARVTSTGKANKQDVKSLKGNIQRNEEIEQKEYTFAEYLDAARAQYNDEDAVLVANEAFKNQDITLFADQSQSPEA